MVLLLFLILDENLRKHKPKSSKCRRFQIRDNVCSLTTEVEIMFFPKKLHQFSRKKQCKSNNKISFATKIAKQTCFQMYTLSSITQLACFLNANVIITCF